jgi:ATP-binding cassette subfamily F protein 3
VRQFAPFVFPGPDVIRLRNVALRRGEKLLLQDAQLMVHAGQKLGVVGPNG